LSPLVVKEAFSIIRDINQNLRVTVVPGRAEYPRRNVGRELRLHHGPGRDRPDGTADELRNNEDVKEFYLGGAASNARASRTSRVSGGASAGSERHFRDRTPAR
jgi:branched-chain amino acid transport system ATP-binding protein